MQLYPTVCNCGQEIPDVKQGSAVEEVTHQPLYLWSLGPSLAHFSFFVLFWREIAADDEFPHIVLLRQILWWTKTQQPLPFLRRGGADTHGGLTQTPKLAFSPGAGFHLTIYWGDSAQAGSFRQVLGLPRLIKVLTLLIQKPKFFVGAGFGTDLKSD